MIRTIHCIYWTESATAASGFEYDEEHRDVWVYDGAVADKLKDDEFSVDSDVPMDAILPKYSQAVCNHSPDGFNWGYGGSGPGQLALAICLEYLGRKDAVKLYQDFKREFIAQGSQEENLIIEVDVEAWAAAKLGPEGGK